MPQRLMRILCLMGVLTMMAPGFTVAMSNSEQKDLLAEIPPVSREFRAAWVATVANIDWPSKPGLSTEDQKAEAIKIMDLAADLNMNALVFQVRPHADAMYPSDLEPWSYYLTGEQGKAPEPYYDPLKFWVDESHKRGIQLHCWFNPYRAHHSAQKGAISEQSLVKKRPDLAKKLANGMYWLDPARKEVQDHSIAVVMDVVKRYDIDGVHFDDYFYPYPSYNDDKDFPDDDTYAAYQAEGGKLDRGDFRRKAVNDFMERLYKEIKKERKTVQFGLSPFGIYRPGHPRSIAGFDQYDKLYADALLWLEEGWVDYFTPQLYWPISQTPQSYPVLLGWWVEQNKKERHIWPGIFTSKYSSPNNAAYDEEEIPREILVTRGMPGATGHVHFSMKMFFGNEEGLTDKLRKGLYSEPAIVPTSPWLDKKAPKAPTVDPVAPAAEANEDFEITWKHDNPDDVFVYVVYWKQGSSWKDAVVTGGNTSFVIPAAKTETVTKTTGQGLDTKEETVAANPIEAIAISAVDRLGNESDRVLLDLPAR